jgi:hypothetical protein
LIAVERGLAQVQDFQKSAEGQMLSRILAAVKLAETDITILAVDGGSRELLISLLERWNSTYALGFFNESDQSHGIQAATKGLTLVTHSLSTLIDRPELKKSTWEYLQELRQRIKE